MTGHGHPRKPIQWSHPAGLTGCQRARRRRGRLVPPRCYPERVRPPDPRPHLLLASAAATGPARPGRRVRREWRACRSTARRLARPAFTISVPAWRLPAWGCASATYLLNQWVIPMLAACTAVRALRPRHPQAWLTVTVATVAVLLLAKAAAVELRPSGGRR